MPTEQAILDNRKHYYSHSVQSVETKNEDKNSFGSLMKFFLIYIFSCCDHMKILRTATLSKCQFLLFTLQAYNGE